MKRFSIVGIGASAGGLEAFTQLLENLPTDSGLGFVLVQHLDPTHESALTALLSKATKMPVVEAVDGAAVEPNHVYIIPPNSNIRIKKGVIRLLPRQKSGARHEVDTFFQSLAEDQNEYSIGIILSGTASDGTFGLEAIKAEGGITFAQDESAKYDGMPRSAIEAGCVDFVLSPKAIAAELRRISSHPLPGFAGEKGRGAAKPAKRPGTAKAKANDPFEQILLLLRNHTSVDFSLYKPGTLQRRVNRRLILLKMKTVEAYLVRLRTDPQERDALYQDVLISVTGFFRNPDAFEALKRVSFPQIFKARKLDDPVRVWVPGCSTGQEAYSLAMALLEFMGDNIKIPLQIYATDLNDTVLQKARAGLYAKSVVQDVSSERLRRFFVQEEDAYRVVKSVRDLCVFANHNAIAHPPFSRIDLLSCRNLLIYIDPEVQKKAIASFHYALKPNGTLFLGASETLASFSDLFSPVDKKHRIYLKLPGPTRPMKLPFPILRQQADKPSPMIPAMQEVRGFDVQREADRITLAKYSPPGVLINAGMEILQFRGQTSPYLQPPQGHATFHLLKMARESILLPLRAVVNKAKKNNRRARTEVAHIDQSGRAHKVHIEVLPLKNSKERCFLIFFESGSRRGAKVQPAVGESESPPSLRTASSRTDSSEVSRLKEELAETRDYLQSIQEQYEAANEELQASGEEVQSGNEELQSINEELQTSKEELESTNEELTTVNDEMSNRNVELTKVTGDLNNLHMSVDMAILLLDRDLRIERFTPQAKKIFNLMPSDMGRPFSAVKSTLDFPDLEKFVLEVIAKLVPQERELRDFSGRWYSFRARPYLTLDNKVDGAVVTIVDITDLKGALQKAEAIAETVPPLLVLDSDLRVRMANRSFCDTFHVSRTETEGRLIYELGSGQWDIPMLRTLLKEILPRDKVVANFEVEHDFEGIGIRAMLLNGRMLDLGDAGKTILLSILDVTRNKAVTEIEAHSAELERRVGLRTAEMTASNNELEAFCYSVAHDLRTPLRGIEGFSRILLKSYADKLDARGKEYFERIRSATYHMSHLIDSLLDLAHLTRAEMKREEIDLSEQVRMITQELKTHEPLRAVEFVIAPDVKTIGDSRFLQIALTNIIHNAWKFTSKHPSARIEFGVMLEDGEPVYFIRDDGAGFDMAYADKLFTTFQRLHTAEEFPGTGIGLTIAQRIIQKHGGRIWAEGSVERGATFFFSLSRAEKPQPRTPTHARRKLPKRAPDKM